MSVDRLRRTARVLLLDERGDVLLIRFVAQRPEGPYTFWVTPGGEVEARETDLAAAQRELLEELGLQCVLSGPIHEERGGTYMHLGEHVRNYDVFFLAHCSREEPTLRGVTSDEIALMREARWWSVGDLRSSEEEIFPGMLADLVTRVAPNLQQA